MRMLPALALGSPQPPAHLPQTTMNIRNIFSTCLFALALSLPMAGCDGDDDTDTSTSSDDEAATDADADTDTSDDSNLDIECIVFCEAYVTQCIQGQMSEEFETNDLCLEACNAWDQAGINCRYGQIPDACDQAGNMGSAC